MNDKERDKERSREQRVRGQGCGDMKHPQAIFLSLSSLTVKRQKLHFHAVNFAVL